MKRQGGVLDLEKLGLKAGDDEAQKNTATQSDGKVQFSLNESFPNEFDAWMEMPEAKRLNSKGRFLIGSTSDTLLSIGVPDYKIYWDKSALAIRQDRHNGSRL